VAIRQPDFTALNTAERKANLTPSGVQCAPASIVSPSAVDSIIASSPTTILVDALGMAYADPKPYCFDCATLKRLRVMRAPRWVGL
jgi:hypothetical protein